MDTATIPDPVLQAVEAFTADMNRGDLDAALAHYEPQAAFVAEPGRVVQGQPAIRHALAELITLGATLRTRGSTALHAGDMALYQAHWELLIGGKPVQEGDSSDVLRRDAQGRWRIAIDNPWGSVHLMALPA